MGNRTDGLSIGDPAYGSFGQYGIIKVRAGTVTRVTPTGQIAIDFGEIFGGNGQPRLRRFGNTGHEIGCGRYDAGYLIDHETYTRLAEKQKVQDAKSAIVNLLRSWSFKNKAELNSLVDRLVRLAALIPDDESTLHAASGMEARSGETEGLDPKDDSPVAESETPNLSEDHP